MVLKEFLPLELVFMLAWLCCINMDPNTPDENLWAMYEIVQRYRRYGA
jgi:hypothetical protein